MSDPERDGQTECLTKEMMLSVHPSKSTRTMGEALTQPGGKRRDTLCSDHQLEIEVKMKKSITQKDFREILEIRNELNRAIVKCLEAWLKLYEILVRRLMRLREPFSTGSEFQKMIDDPVDPLPKHRLSHPIKDSLPGGGSKSLLPLLEAATKRAKKVECRWCKRPLYDENVTFCSSCVRFKSQKEMLDYRNNHPEEVDEDGRLMRFYDPDDLPEEME